MLLPVYRELGIEWDPETTGDLASALPGIDLETVADSMLTRVAEEADLVEIEPDSATIALAEQLAPRHVVDDQPIPRVSASLTAE